MEKHVWHKGILYKLYTLDCPKYMIHLVKDYLLRRSLQVKVNHQTSAFFHPKQGLPQGSPLSPFLYNIYCCDLFIQNNPDPPEHLISSYGMQFADDTAIISHNKTREKAMPRNYKRKTDRASWTSATLQEALVAIENGRAVREVSRSFAIPGATLQDRRRNGKVAKGQLGRCPVFSQEQ
ncbi:hypothetical protein JTB14_020268 [Gonioctena quinquepunctata]|nr:hypothetical protein JTB14_020268 [Gonioctena quinquepunctata]